MIGGHRVDIQSQSAVRRKASGIFDDIGPDHLLIHQSKTILVDPEQQAGVVSLRLT